MDFKIGDRVIDDQGDTGIVIEIVDEHNIQVNLYSEYGEGKATYCCAVGCPEYFPCYHHVI